MYTHTNPKRTGHEHGGGGHELVRHHQAPRPRVRLQPVPPREPHRGQPPAAPALPRDHHAVRQQRRAVEGAELGGQVHAHGLLQGRGGNSLAIVVLGGRVCPPRGRGWQAVQGPELVVHGAADVLERGVREHLHAAALEAAEEETREVAGQLSYWGVGVVSGPGG